MGAEETGPEAQQEGWVEQQRKSWREEVGLEPVRMWSRDRKRHWNSLRYGLGLGLGLGVAVRYG